jgi:hypothetical protein
MRLEGEIALGSEGDRCCIASLEERWWVGSELSWIWRGGTKRTGTVTSNYVLLSWLYCAFHQGRSCHGTC